MFIADMYCYGMDANAVGVTGISGCMGVFVATGAMLYAVHIPDTATPGKNALGGTTFADFVTQQVGQPLDPNASQMICVLNYTQRQQAHEEGYAIARRLGLRRFALWRMEKNIDVSTGNPKAIWVLWQRLALGGLELRYRPDADFTPTQGGGTARSGTYSPWGADKRYTVDASGWYLGSAPNAHGMTYHDCT
jgi:hypothetical protein